jgi:Tol biopolymer transport system component
VSPLASPTRAYAPVIRASRDGRQIAVIIGDITDEADGLWLYDVQRGSLTLLQRGGEPGSAVWSSDGQHVVFVFLQNGRVSLGSRPVDGSAALELLATGGFVPMSWARGNSVIGVENGDLAIATLEKRPARVELLRRTADEEQSPELSPDGRWLAYGSNASGRREIYVEAYPLGGPRTPVSIEGGDSPAWHPKRT